MLACPPWSSSDAGIVSTSTRTRTLTTSTTGPISISVWWLWTSAGYMAHLIAVVALLWSQRLSAARTHASVITAIVHSALVIPMAALFWFICRLLRVIGSLCLFSDHVIAIVESTIILLRCRALFSHHILLLRWRRSTLEGINHVGISYLYSSDTISVLIVLLLLTLVVRFHRIDVIFFH